MSQRACFCCRAQLGTVCASYSRMLTDLFAFADSNTNLRLICSMATRTRSLFVCMDAFLSRACLIRRHHCHLSGFMSNLPDTVIYPIEVLVFGRIREFKSVQQILDRYVVRLDVYEFGNRWWSFGSFGSCHWYRSECHAAEVKPPNILGEFFALIIVKVLAFPSHFLWKSAAPKPSSLPRYNNVNFSVGWNSHRFISFNDCSRATILLLSWS